MANSSEGHGGRRSASADFTQFWVKMLVFSLLVLAFPLSVVARTMGQPTYAPTVEIHDNVSLVNTKALKQDLEKINFYQPTHVGILTVGDLVGNGLNDNTHKFAQTNQTDTPWISTSNPNYWSDGLFIFAVGGIKIVDGKPTGQVGTYFGQDILPSKEMQKTIQDSAKDSFRSGDWYGGIVKGVSTTAEHIGRPWYMSWGVLFGSVLCMLVGLAGFFAVLGRKPKVQRMLADAEKVFARVNDNWEDTTIQGQTIDPSQKYGAAIRERYRVFMDRYHALARMFLDFGTPSGVTWYTKSAVDTARGLDDRSLALEDMNKAILNSAALLNMTSQWHHAWDNEVGPIMEDFQSLEKLTRDIESPRYAKAPRKLREELHGKAMELDQMTTALENKTITPSAALDALNEIASWTSASAYRLVTGSFDSHGSSTAHAQRRAFERQQQRTKPQLYKGHWEFEGKSGDYDPATTIRPTIGAAMWDYGNVGFQDASEFDSRWMNPMWGWNNMYNSPTFVFGGFGGGSRGVSSASSAVSSGALTGLVMGYTSASAASAASSGSASSSGGFSGGGFSGGGFSGGGSSSSF